MITKQDLLNMTFKDIENKMNSVLHLVTTQSEDDTYLKGLMIDEVEKLFGHDVITNVPYYTNREMSIRIGELIISFGVGVKKTGKTIQVSRLKKKDIKKAGNFKFQDAVLKLNNPCFDAKDLDNYKVKLTSDYVTGGARISFKHRKDIITDILSKESIKSEVIAQCNDWRDFLNVIILNAAQPKIKVETFKPNFNQEKWDEIIDKTYQENKELIDSVAENLFVVKI